jgi:hypothetical protein
MKKPKKQEMNMLKRFSKVAALLATAKKANIKNVSPPKHAVIRRVCLKVMSSLGEGRKNEKGHQIKSLSASQL